MTADSMAELTIEALWLVLILSLPAVATSIVIAVIIAVGQAVTQIQDQSIGQSVRQIAVLAVLLLTTPWIATTFWNFGSRIFAAITQGRLPP